MRYNLESAAQHSSPSDLQVENTHEDIRPCTQPCSSRDLSIASFVGPVLPITSSVRTSYGLLGFRIVQLFRVWDSLHVLLKELRWRFELGSDSRRKYLEGMKEPNTL